MNRRKLLATIGALGTGGAVVTGTGAFTSVSANRDVSVSVADDTDALLRIADTGNENAAYVTESGGEFGIDLTGDNDALNGSGVNANATTVIEDLFEVRNQGTQEVSVEATPLSFVDAEGSDTLIVLVVPQTSFPAVELGVGETETYSLIVDTFPGGDGLEVNDEVTISAEATA